MERHLERTDILDMMGSLKLFGMRSAFDEIVTTAVKRQHEPQRLVRRPAQGRDRREARPIDQVPDDHRQAAARQGRRRLHLRRHADQRDARARPSPAGHFIAEQRNLRPRWAAPGTGKTHLAIAIARSCIRAGSRGPLLQTRSTSSTGSRPRPAPAARDASPDYLTRMDFVVLDELGYLPFAQSGGQLLFHLISRLYERTSVIVTTNLALRRMADRLRAMPR